ncbi:MAG: hypothetical protein HRJ53_07510 [Acidobacteria bacterium Pan2503]|uniref:Uncharacterized protein n=1 Tax=Candidatus Acidiferrum panamense TaxID=2741543 RepID=A0A7V8SW21_9BACT|nr:hypothetical protein [Candidatus Acidoferrum panamensis]
MLSLAAVALAFFVGFRTCAALDLYASAFAMRQYKHVRAGNAPLPETWLLWVWRFIYNAYDDDEED